MSWTSTLADATALQRVFGGDPPELRETRVHEVTLSRDGPQVTIRIDLPTYPTSPPAKWRTQGFNTVQAEITFVGARDISVEGFGRDPIVDIEITRTDSIRISIDSPEFRLHLAADAAILSKVTAYVND
ncbi:MAG: Imm50 family immunity protein [Streptomyces sp.]|uniref:Imm50 family immunity protein n=1 Tax=Streptomyces sp. TaxID=1931 RepID=UPI003D6B332D